MDEKRRWGRLTVSDKKLISCRIVEPEDLVTESGALVLDINPGGLSFLYNKKLNEERIIRFMIKFPFTTYKEESIVWGKVIYCHKLPDREEYLVGIAFIKR